MPFRARVARVRGSRFETDMGVLGCQKRLAAGQARLDLRGKRHGECSLSGLLARVETHIGGQAHALAVYCATTMVRFEWETQCRLSKHSAMR